MAKRPNRKSWDKSTPPRPEKRTQTGQYEKGSGHGGHREGAGRKPDATKKALETVLHEPLGGKAGGRNLVELAQETILDALMDRSNGRVTKAAVQAAINVMDRKYGRPKQTHQVDVGTADLIRFAESVSSAADQSRELAAQPQ